jgi:energy-coupling factor transporter ATP-binding protein EcfA2
MIVPRRAPVRPRVTSGESGATLLLEDAVQGLIASARRGSIKIDGPSGSGKTTALEHLAHVFAGETNLQFVEGASNVENPKMALNQWIVFTVAGPGDNERPTARFTMAPWGRDEWIEYLLAVHRAECTSVMGRLRDENDCRLLAGNPELWRIVLDLLAGDAELATLRQALTRHLDTRLPDAHAKIVAAAYSLSVLVVIPRLPLHETDAEFRKRKDGDIVVSLLRQRAAQVLAAVGPICADVRSKSTCDYFRFHFPRDLIEEVAAGGRDEVEPGGRLPRRRCVERPEFDGNRSIGRGFERSGSFGSDSGVHEVG